MRVAHPDGGGSDWLAARINQARDVLLGQTLTLACREHGHVRRVQLRRNCNCRDVNVMKPLRKAVLPVAGLGTRFLPATKAMAKEMLPVVDKPLIQYAVEEARAAGIEQFCMVTGRGKTALVEHFDIAYELEATLRERGKTELIADAATA